MKDEIKELLRLDSTQVFKSYEEDEAFYIEGFSSTCDVDRDYEVIPPSSVNLENFKKNPIILYQHNRDKPIGKAVDIQKRENGIWLKVLISKTAKDVIQMIKEGILSAFSCGFRIKDYDVKEDGLLIYKDIEYLETSIVAVPCNPEARFAMCKSYNEQLKNKEIEIPKPTSKENKMNELEIMKKELEDMKQEKARLEAEKAEQLRKEKELKIEAEKKAMEDKIKGLTENFETVVSKLKLMQETYEASKAEFDEKLEAAKKAAPRIEEVPATEKTIEAFMESYKDAQVYSTLFKKDFKDTLIFQKLPERAKAISLDTQFTTRVQNQMLEDVKEKAVIVSLFEQLPSNVTTDTYPFASEITPAWGAVSEATWTPTKVNIDYKSIFAYTTYDYVSDEEAIIAWMPTLRRKLNESIAEGLDTAAVNATTVTNAYTALPQWAINADTTNVATIGDELDLTVADIDEIRALMGKYGVNPSNLALILNSAKYLQLLNDADVATVDKYGSGATILKGELGKVRGIPIFVNDSAVGSNALSGYACTLVNRKLFGFKLKSMMVETDKTITSQTMSIVASARAGLGPLTPLNSGAITGAFVVVGQNPAS